MANEIGAHRWYGVAESAELLGVSISTIRRLAKRGELVSKHFGRRLFIAGYSLRADAEPIERVKPVETVTPEPNMLMEMAEQIDSQPEPKSKPVVARKQAPKKRLSGDLEPRVIGL